MKDVLDKVKMNIAVNMIFKNNKNTENVCLTNTMKNII